MADSPALSKEIPKAYDPKSIEERRAASWIERKLASPSPESDKTPFTIVIPPPNVTGSLHMGHALNNTLQDFLIRYQKMRGHDALWVPGTDHGGIATQNVVEKLLKQEKVSRHQLGREKFLERMWRWRQESGDTILMQLRRLGCLLDWSRARFTMDEVCSRAVTEAFFRLFREGRIYRGKRMVNWCVRCHTALSDIEVEFEERKDKLYYIRYPILSGVKDGWQGKPLVVATTRPETMLGDQAVAVNPDDARYEKISGWWIQLPLMDREIPVIKDELVDPEFGTGAVKVTPAHDPADFEMGERHNLAREVVIGFDGKMTSAAGKYAGLSRDECRKKVLEDLEAQGFLEKTEDYVHSVGTCYRCGVAVEPLVSDQWFLSVKEMSRAAAGATRDGKVVFYPESWTKPYLDWLDNLKDWCVSRQIWWGHRLPIWYCLKNEAGGEAPAAHPAERTSCPPIPAEERPPKCPECGGTSLEQDPDVLDTWFSSALWPFSVFGWPADSPDLKRFYPTSVLVTGHEILYLWVARMVMFGLAFMEKVPFRQVFIHGIVRDKQGRKMSKSLGNVVDPLGMMDQYGTDALRFVLVSQSVPGRDMQISNDAFVGARNFVNKLWNAGRFALMNRGAGTEPGGDLAARLKAAAGSPGVELADLWILSRFSRAAAAVDVAIAEYNLAQAVRTLYHFVWSEFCDWYLELAKIRVLDPEGGAGRETAFLVRDAVLEGILRLLHPVMPFVTEEIWESFSPGGTGAGLVGREYPAGEPELVSEEAESGMENLMAVIGAVRTIRSEMNVPPGQKVRLHLKCADSKTASFLSVHGRYLRHLCKADEAVIGTAVPKPAKSASAVAAGVEIFVPLAGLIDFDKERRRLAKDLEAVAADLSRTEERLENPDFRRNAPKEEAEKIEKRLAESREKARRLKEHLASIGAD